MFPSHANGYKFDFAKNTQLNSYVTNTFTRIADRGDGYPQWKAASGNIYCVSVAWIICNDIRQHELTILCRTRVTTGM
jgi:hypothetical protein